jgi:hypothetical protein
MIESKKKQEVLTATAIGPGDFPLGSLPSRAAARLRLQGIGETGKGSPSCICFPEDEEPFFCWPIEERIAASVKCPLHGTRFKLPIFHVYVPKWLREKQPLHLLEKSLQYQKAWAASFPPDLWPAEEMEVDGKTMLRLKDGSMLEAQ